MIHSENYIALIIHLPSRNLLLCYRVIANARDADLATARAAGQLLIAPIFAQSTAIARAHVAKIATLPRLASRRKPVGSSGSGSSRGGCCGGGAAISRSTSSVSCARTETGTGTGAWRSRD